MALRNWLIAGAIFIILIFLALGLGWWFRNHPAPGPTNKYTAPLAWGNPVPGPDPNKNLCQQYTFGTSNINGKIYPGNPTFNSLILDSMTGVIVDSTTNNCTDVDQLYATQVQHTCTAPLGVIDGQLSMCRLLTGGVTGVDGVEVFYNADFCPVQIPCPGQLAVVALHYNPNQNLNCIQNTDQGVIVVPCDPSESGQLFRITRTALGINPNSLTNESPQNGLLGQIYDRTTGLCLGLGSGLTATTYNPDLNVSCKGTTGNYVATGPTVALTACTGNITSGTEGSTGAPYPGYNWAFFPSMRYCSYPEGGCDQQCSGSCIDCTQVFNANACASSSGCYDCGGYPYLITPPQISYIADVNISQLPYGIDASYAGLTGSSATVQWLLDNNVKSLYYGGYGTGLILKPFGLNSNWCPDRGFSSQYINIATYNTISQENICYAQGLTSSSCINF